jgi:hypothetical protein
MSQIGIVGFSFGLRAEPEEPNPSNLALSVAVRDAASVHRNCVVVTQWEITKAIQQAGDGNIVTRSVELNEDGSYLDSEGVWEAAKAIFQPLGIREVIIVGQPFLHLWKLKQMVRADSYTVVDFTVGHIPFDNSEKNTQPWTRTRPATTIYAIKSVLGMKPGHGGKQYVN